MIKNIKAFTLIEIMIVVVIIFLLAAMVIPAFQKVREYNLRKRALNGGKLTPEQRQWLKEKDKEKNDYTDRIRGNSGQNSSSSDLKVLDSGGIKYFLIPKSSNTQEIIIGGETFYMIPAQN